MVKRKKHLMTDLKNILNSGEVQMTAEERQILSDAYTQLEHDTDVNRCIFELKAKLSELSLTKGLSPDLLAYFTELSRREPSTSVSSMWNFLVTKKSH